MSSAVMGCGGQAADTSTVTDFDEDSPTDRPARRNTRPGNRRPSGPRRPKSWIPEPAEDGEPAVLTEEQRTRIAERCMNLAVWHLGQGARTHKQLADAMAKHDAPADIIEKTMTRLVDLGYVNDTAYAASYVQSRHEGQRKGSGAIRRELQSKGVDSETIAEALEAVDGDAERANAFTLARRKALSTQGVERQKRVQRIVGMLVRKGYSMGVAFEVTREAIDDADTDEDAGIDLVAGDDID